MTLDLTSSFQTEMTSVKTIPGQNDLWKYIPEGEHTLPDRARPKWLLEKLSETEMTSDKTAPDQNDPRFDITVPDWNDVC